MVRRIRQVFAEVQGATTFVLFVLRWVGAGEAERSLA
jgi:hypothetical protein